MKNIIISINFKHYGMALFLALFSITSLCAQKNEIEFDYDATEAINKLPKEDGTYLIKKVKKVSIYAIVDGGELVGFECKDKKGELIQFVEPSVENPNEGVQSLRPLGCKCCIKYGCISYSPPCGRVECR